MKRRGLLVSALGLTGLATVQTSWANKPIRLVVPFATGTTTDMVGRLVADRLERQLAVSVIVENKPGAGGAIGSDAVAKSGGDTTLLLGTVGTHAINPALYKRLSYQPQRDFVPLGFLGATPTLLVVPASSPWRSLAEMRSGWGRDVSFASAGNGTSGHLAGELLGLRLGKEALHVPYRDGAQALTEVIAGNVSFMFYHPAAVLPHIRSGRLRALGVSSARRSLAVPDLPTLMEQGVPDFDLVAWLMLYAPVSAQKDQIARLQTAVQQVLGESEMREKLLAQGVELAEMGPSAMLDFGVAEASKWGEVVKRSGAQID